MTHEWFGSSAGAPVKIKSYRSGNNRSVPVLEATWTECGARSSTFSERDNLYIRIYQFPSKRDSDIWGLARQSEVRAHTTLLPSDRFATRRWEYEEGIRKSVYTLFGSYWHKYFGKRRRYSPSHSLTHSLSLTHPLTHTAVSTVPDKSSCCWEGGKLF